DEDLLADIRHLRGRYSQARSGAPDEIEVLVVDPPEAESGRPHAVSGDLSGRHRVVRGPRIRRGGRPNDRGEERHSTFMVSSTKTRLEKTRLHPKAHRPCDARRTKDNA